MKGIVFDEGGLSVVTDLTVRDLRPDEVRVDIQAAGVCHSDVSVIDGTIPFPTPVVLGHEGVGIVSEVGSGVVGVKLGDHVVISTLSNCGACAACDSGQPTHCRESIGKMSAPFRQGERKVLQFANIGAFSEQTVVKARQAVPINKDVPFEVASLLGCGVITGVGAVFNRAKVTHGQSVLVIGVGGIGLNVIQVPWPTRCRSLRSTPTLARKRWPVSSGRPTSSTRPRSTPSRRSRRSARTASTRRSNASVTRPSSAPRSMPSDGAAPA